MSTSQSLPAWKEEVAAKINEHRSRQKGSPQSQGRLAEVDSSFSPAPRQPAASRIAARIAERYSKAPSYREMLEQQAAEAPARLISNDSQQSTARAAARAKRAAQPEPQSSPEPDLFQDPPPIADVTVANPTAPSAEPVARQSVPEPITPQQNFPQQPVAAAHIQTEPRARRNRWAEFDPSPVPEFFSGPPPAPAEPETAPEPQIESQFEPQIEAIAPEPTYQPEAAPATETSPVVSAPQEQAALPQANPEAEEDPTLFLLAELASQPIEPTQPLPARIIEFPRELVAPRKARPRHERSPEEQDDHHSQLRIFEAEPDQPPIAEPEAAQPVAKAAPLESEIAPPAPAPDWNAIRLDEETLADPALFTGNLDLDLNTEPSSLLLDPPIYTASFEDRLMAGIFDLCLVGAGFLAFVAAFAAATSHIPTGKLALIGAFAAFLAFYIVYQYLFLNFAEATPGMRYAQIALCTFDDENPTRKAMRSRVGFMLLSALPLGLGLLWSLFDEDRLAWHDRITRTYQRSYRAQ